MPILQDFMIGRRALVAAGGAATLAGGLGWSAVSLGTIPPKAHKGADPMTYITASDGAQIFYKDWGPRDAQPLRSEEHTSELQSLMRSSSAVFCFKKKKQR